MSLSAQAKVLRVLQESMISRVGADKDKSGCSCGCRDQQRLEKEIAEGRFREDLYHRLAVILIKVPSLNERREDIPLLISILQTKLLEHGNAKKEISKDAVKFIAGI
jgi:DNA-binding NtrC family response regulator